MSGLEIDVPLPKASLMTVRGANNEWSVDIWADGQVDIAGFVGVDDAARKFWEALGLAWHQRHSGARSTILDKAGALGRCLDRLNQLGQYESMKEDIGLCREIWLELMTEDTGPL